MKNGIKVVPTIPLGLYIHIPFCERKCPYCDFYSVTDCEKMGRYLTALGTQIKEYGAVSSCYKVNTIFIGGGTPSLLEPKQLESLIKAIYKNFNIAEKLEFTMEANPNSLTLKKLKAMRRLGVNRLSIGAQSFDDKELQSIGRLHTAEQVTEAFKLARKAKFKNINLDLMFGLPNQSSERFYKNLEQVFELGAEHISAYGLKIEEGTPFYAQREQLHLADDDLWAEMYENLIEKTKTHGYMQYEVSNFARGGAKCLHNLKYWRLEEYLGLGAAAHSFFGNRRFSFVADTEKYCDIIEGKSYERPIDEYFEVPAKEAVSDYIMLGLRLTEGIDTEVFVKLFNRDFEQFLGGKLKKYIASGHIAESLHSFHFTTKGFCISNYILADLLDQEG